MRTKTDPSTRFWRKVVKRPGDGCWEWTGGRGPHGHGTFHPADGESAGAHRYAYSLLVGPIPVGLVLDHLCRNPSCVRPEHLEPVTNATNVMRGTGWGPTNKAKTHCPKGHEYTVGNTIRERPRGSLGTKRKCKVCKYAFVRDYKRQQRAGLLPPSPGLPWEAGKPGRPPKGALR